MIIMLESGLSKIVRDAYKTGAEEANKMLLEAYEYGVEVGYAKAKAEIGEIELGDIDG